MPQVNEFYWTLSAFRQMMVLIILFFTLQYLMFNMIYMKNKVSYPVLIMIF